MARSRKKAVDRVSTSVAGLDVILGGGLLSGGIYMVTGRPGAGKTILANQVCFGHLARGGRALYVSLLAETHTQLIAHLETLSFFDKARVGDGISYISGYATIEQEGLDGLLKLLRRAVREHGSDLLVLDGLVTAEVLAPSQTAFKKFIHALQAWVGVVGCTVLLLTSNDDTLGPRPAHTMVDGIIDLATERADMRNARMVTVTKFRGSGFLEGRHSYVITGDGIVVYPRVEAALQAGQIVEGAADELVPSGIDGLDRMMGGGLRAGETTLLLGSSGAGKTVFGMHFLDAGVRRKERCGLFGFFERPKALVAKARRLGLSLRGVDILWQPPTEPLLDALGDRLLRYVRSERPRRLFIDGLVGFERALHAQRLATFFSAVADELRTLGVATLITEETRELYVREVEVPTEGVSAMFGNIIFVRQIERDAELARLISVMKTRDTRHERVLRAFEITDRGIRIGDAVHGITGRERVR